MNWRTVRCQGLERKLGSLARLGGLTHGRLVDDLGLHLEHSTSKLVSISLALITAVLIASVILMLGFQLKNMTSLSPFTGMINLSILAVKNEFSRKLVNFS